MKNKYKVLFVCHGNICRSPMAEFIFKAVVKAHGEEELFHIESAAVSSEEIGSGIYPPAKRCLKAHGIAYSESKTARKVTAEDYDNFDLILCMDRSNISRIKRIIPEDPANKIHLMMSCVSMAYGYIHDAGAESAPDVADPWYTGDFETTFQDLLLSCEALLTCLTKQL